MDLFLETERLFLRPIDLTDAKFIIELVNSKGWIQYIGDRNISNQIKALQYIQGIIDNKNSFYTVFGLKKTRKAIGIVTFLNREDENWPDIGFAMLPGYAQNGFAFEAAKSYLEKVQESNEHENILGITLPQNVKSINLLQRLGFQYRGDYEKGEKILSYYVLKSNARSTETDSGS